MSTATSPKSVTEVPFWMGTATIFRREFFAFFTTPVAAIFLVIFLVMSGVMTFNVGRLVDPQGEASLRSFFNWHPWLYLFLVPALTFAALALALTFPVWLTVSYLGNPDHGVIAAGYVGSVLLSGGFLAVGSAVSAVSHNQVVAFVLSVAACFFLLLTGWGPVQSFFNGWLPPAMSEVMASISFMSHFVDSFVRGVIDVRDLVFFATVIAAGLWITGLLLQSKRHR